MPKQKVNDASRPMLSEGRLSSNSITISEDLSHGAKIEERQLLALRDPSARSKEIPKAKSSGGGDLKRLLNDDYTADYGPPARHYDDVSDPFQLPRTGGASLFRQRKRPRRDSSPSQLERNVSEMDAAELRSFIESLEERATSLETSKNDPTSQSPPKHRILYRIADDTVLLSPDEDGRTDQRIRTYFDQPEWISGQDGTGTLRCQLPLHNFDLYLEKNKDLFFIVYMTYHVQASQSTASSTADRNPSGKQQMTIEESIEPVTQELKEAVTIILESKSEFLAMYDDYERTSELQAPYLWVFHQRRDWESILKALPTVLQDQADILWQYILESYGKNFAIADTLLSNGKITSEFLEYLYKPGDVIVECKNGQHMGYIVKSWPQNENVRLKSELLRRRQMNRNFVSGYSAKNPTGLRHKGKQGTQVWSIDVWHWTFDGEFRRRSTSLRLHIPASQEEMRKVNGITNQLVDNGEVFNITQLQVFPLRYASEEVVSMLRRRGRSFWACRSGGFVSYQESEDESGNNMQEERYMVDLKTYQSLHDTKKDYQYDNSSWDTETNSVHELSSEAMKSDKPPDTTFELLLPLSIKGYNMRKKKWYDLVADRISEVKWNKEAFEKVVMDKKAKDLIRALVSNQLASEVNTDLIEGKGNGLIMLLHGGPGTGKTLTAESVAEISEKPLYRVTCGDVGTKAEEVEKYLESVLHLGKLWGCVVLLDEADVFLEERSLRDLDRNALVSVFLRVLEYYEGIIILTSNRVGTFDEAFKSRIQLALHYPALGPYQRLRIWENFLDRLEKLDDGSIDLDDIRNHLEDLQKDEMNGRQIRNAITTARQYAKWKKATLTFQHLKDVIEVSGRFDQYLSKIRGGLTEDQLAEDEGLR